MSIYSLVKSFKTIPPKIACIINNITMKNIKYFVLLLAIATSFSSCFVRGHRGERGHEHEMHHDGDRH
jgi:hypothetical protein